MPWWPLLAGVVALPIALAAVRGVRRGYLPIGDNALIEMRARDVLTAHHPWLGTWSSASISSDVDVNHPGPLLFDVLAPWVRLLGAGPGVAFGVAALQIVVVVAIGWCADRIGGRSAAVATLAVTAVLTWSIGSELLYDPWQPNVLMLPFFLLLILVWGVVAGRHLMLPGAVLVASFCVQTHLSYVFLAPAVVLAGVIAVAARGRGDGGRPGWAATAPRPLGMGLAVGLLAWAQPLIEQLTGPGQGNLARLAASGGGGEGIRTGPTLAIRMVAAVVALPPWFTRSGMTESVPVTPWADGPDGPAMVVPALPGLAVAFVALLVAGALMVAVAVLAVRRGDRVVGASVVVLAAAFAVAFVTVVITPIDRLGLSPHKIRWLWPLGAFAALVPVLAATRWLTAPLDRGRGATGNPDAAGGSRTAGNPVVMAVIALVTVGFAAATVPFHAHAAGPVGWRADTARIRGLTAELDGLRGRGTVLFDASGLYFAEPFTAPVMAGLQRAGVTFVLDEEDLVRQLGERRRFTGDADLRVYVRVGPEALIIPPETERVAFQPALDTAELAELTAFEKRLADWRAAAGPGSEQLPADAALGDLGALAAAGEVDLGPALGDDLDRYLELDGRWRHDALAVFAERLR